MNSPAFVKNDDTRFSNNLYSQVSIRQVHLRVVDEDSLVPRCIYSITCITLMY